MTFSHKLLANEHLPLCLFLQTLMGTTQSTLLRLMTPESSDWDHELIRIRWSGWRVRGGATCWTFRRMHWLHFAQLETASIFYLQSVVGTHRATASSQEEAETWTRTNCERKMLIDQLKNLLCTWWAGGEQVVFQRRSHHLDFTWNVSTVLKLLGQPCREQNNQQSFSLWL